MIALWQLIDLNSRILRVEGMYSLTDEDIEIKIY
jgi:hypothetical protein